MCQLLDKVLGTVCLVMRVRAAGLSTQDPGFFCKGKQESFSR